jgi:hypothetical protein
MDITKVNIEQLPSGEIQLTSKVMFGIDEFLHTDTVQNLLNLLGVSTTNVKPRLVDLDITVLEANLNTFLNTVNITIAQGEIIFLRFFVIKSNGLLYRVTYTIPLTEGVYVPIGGFVDFDELILINTEYLGVEADANTITRSFNNLGEINTADPAIDFSDDTKVYIVILDSLPYLFEGTLGFYGDGELQMELTDLTLLISPIGVETVSGNIVDNTDPANPIVNTPTLQEVLTAGSYAGGSPILDVSDGNALIASDGNPEIGGDVLGRFFFDGSIIYLDQWNGTSFDGKLRITAPGGSSASSLDAPDTFGFAETIDTISLIINTNTTAINNRKYTAIATLTVTDPTPVEGQGYIVFVRNGTATIGGVGYPSGSLVYRFYQGGVWSSTVFVTQTELKQATFTVELIDELTVDIYAPFDLKINDFEVIVGSGTITIEVNDSAYTLETLIDQGDKITVTTTTASVVNLEVSYE